MLSLLLLAVLLLAGCGSSTTDFATTPTTQASAPTSTSRRVQATFTDGSGHAARSLRQSGSTVEGTALLRRGADVQFARASGSLQNDQLNVRLTTDSRTAAPRILDLSGQLGGTGQLSEQSTGSNNRVALTERAGTGGLLSFEITLPGWYDILCTQTGDFSGDFSCINNSLPVNNRYNGTFTLTVDDETDEAVLDLDQGAAHIRFQLVTPVNTTPWLGNSYIQRDSEQLFEGGGFVTVKD